MVCTKELELLAIDIIGFRYLGQWEHIVFGLFGLGLGILENWNIFLLVFSVWTNIFANRPHFIVISILF